ncbi:hypothetical protein Goshw_019038 [Gossypium schwendimanii]|uniref:DUF4283 domain-containing protein n=1 Tax=Gossypium schwendimanii TaxID=34291 RepID=A0A7J9LBJ0_GOSSC|nr:hypothetical protein [Gossypium schwendimanii]
MDAYLTRLSLEDREEEGWDVIGEDSGYGLASYKLCLVGSFFTASIVNFQAMKNMIANVWHPISGMAIFDLSDKRFLFRFLYDVDINRIEHGDP